MELDYESLKEKVKNNSSLVAYAAGLAATLLIGIGIGRGAAPEKKPESSQLQTNYTTTKPDNQPVVAATPTPEVKGEQTSPAAKPTAPDLANCPIKGNVSSASKIYHVKGGSFYERTNPEMCFQTEGEAVAAGFRKSSR